MYSLRVSPPNEKFLGMRLFSCMAGSRFATVCFTTRFAFTTLVESDRALPTCGASLSQLKRPFCTQCASRSFPVCMCFLFYYFCAVLLSWLWFFHPRCPTKRQKRRTYQTSWHYILSWCLLNHGLGLLQKIKGDLIDIFLIICVIFYILNSLN